MKKKSEKIKEETKQKPPKATSTESVEFGEATGSNNVAEVKKVSKLDVDFGREDLNLMRDKINEIIENGN